MMEDGGPMNTTLAAPARSTRFPDSSRWFALAFAAGMLVAGMAVAMVSMIARPEAVGSNALQLYPPLYPPDWAFWAIWLIIYPCWGVATWLVWRRRSTEDLRPFWRYFALMFGTNLAFLPISALTRGNPAVLAMMDALGFVLLPVMVWMYGRYARAALYWLLPIFVWIPITLALKVWLTLLNW